MQELLDLNETAKYLSVSRKKVWELTRDKLLIAVQDPLDKRRRLFKLSDLKKLKGASKNGRNN